MMPPALSCDSYYYSRTFDVYFATFMSVLRESTEVNRVSAYICEALKQSDTLKSIVMALSLWLSDVSIPTQAAARS